jgi:hypothetical protein
MATNQARAARRLAASVSVALAIAGLAAPASAGGGAVPAPPAGQVTIDTIAVNGSGCRADTVAVAVSPDNEAFTVTYSEYLAQAGGATGRPDERRSCAITVRLNVPPGVTFAVSGVDYRGFAHLEDGASAVHAARYLVPGSGQPRRSERSFSGFFSDGWQVTDLVGTGDLVYALCGGGRKLDIDTELRVAAGPGSPVSMIAMDSTDGSFASTYELAWRSCG